MPILGTGIDIVEIARFERSIARFGERFLDRLFTPEERGYCDNFREPGRCYAARFAAKEAVSKALGTGIGPGAEWREIRVERLPTGKPLIHLTGAAARTAERLGIAHIHLSLSHSEHQAIAEAIAESA